MTEFITADVAYNSDTKAIIDFSGNADMFKAPKTPISIGIGKIVPWGEGNTLPFKVQDMIERNEVVSSNLLFNIQSAYGQGIKPMKRIVENGKVVGYEECTNQKVLTFFEDNDIDGFFLEQVTDMMTFFNVFPEIILSNDGKEIVSLRHLEATFSRYGSMEKNDKEIKLHYYSNWEDGSARADQLVVTPVLSQYNTFEKLKERVSKSNDRRFVLQVSMPTPGRTYYAQPYWWSIFLSGWYDLSEMLPKFKKALLKNHLAVRYIVYVSDVYWKDLEKEKKVDLNNPDAVRRMKEEAVKDIMDFLTTDKSKGSGMISTKKIFPSGSGKPYEDKYIEIVTIEAAVKGGEFIEDSEEVSNIMSYAMGVHPNLNGATPGKSKGSLGGSDKRELFMIKQAMMRPFRDRLLKSLNLVKRYNGWDENIVFVVPEFVFPTLDVEKTGKRETIQNPK